jgi:hypothetical protein
MNNGNIKIKKSQEKTLRKLLKIKRLKILITSHDLLSFWLRVKVNKAVGKSLSRFCLNE